MRSVTMKDSRLETAQLMTPDMANFAGNVHGGRILQLVDQIAYACAAKYAQEYCVTLSVDRVLFKSPVRVGDLLTMRAQINRVGRSSMEVGVRIEAQDLEGGEVRHTNSCFLTMVAVKDGKAVEVPRLVVETDEDRRRNADAELRRNAHRLSDLVQENSARYQDSIELATVAILVIDSSSGKVRRANAAACELLGRAAGELTDRPVWELHPEEHHASARALFETVLAEGFGEADLWHCTPDGSCRMLKCSSWAIPLVTGPLIQRVMRPA